MAQFAAKISEQIWDMKYRLKEIDGNPIDISVKDTWKRIAQSLAKIEDDSEYWEKKYYNILEGFKFLPAGRIIAGVGSEREVTLFNCFVMGKIPDSVNGIFHMLREAAITMQQGGGIGYDFSTLRPKGSVVSGVGADASGPLSFMNVWDSMCRTIMSAGSRRGAMMGTLSCDHPDIEDFIEVKADPTKLRMFNLSVLVSDKFINAVKADRAWNLVFGGKVCKTIPARYLWNKIMCSTFEYAEPGVIFIDRINKLNNLFYCEKIKATNPCGEQPLPPYGACLLGSINLARIIKKPFESNASLDERLLADLVKTSIRMMDNVIDVSKFPLKKQEKEAKEKRRIGLGVTGLADALLMVGIRYGSPEAIQTTGNWLHKVSKIAYLTSIELAREKGVFPLFNLKEYLNSEFIKRMDSEVIEGIRKHGIRNALLTSIAPTGTISLFAGNVSSGIEPIFDYTYNRKVSQRDGSILEEEVVDYAIQIWRKKFGNKTFPDHFVTAQTLDPLEHLKMQSAAQKWIDSSISKTINCPENISFEAFKNIYMAAYESGCKGCTTYRPNSITGSILNTTNSTQKTENSEKNAEVIYIAEPLERSETLEGKTYKLKWPDSEHAIYLTVNDIIFDGKRRPFEVFINSKNMEHFSWTVALTRMISAVFRRGGDVSFVVEELKAVFDPRGGAWIQGKYVPSIIAAIGSALEKHLVVIGFLEREGLGLKNDPHSDIREIRGLQLCQSCGQRDARMSEGCTTCLSCGFSKCG